MNRETAKKRAIFLKRLREQHKETVTLTQKVVKEQNALRRQICKPTREAPQTVPDIAAVTGIPAHEVLWHLMAMKKYGLVVETGMCGEYYLYQKVEVKR